MVAIITDGHKLWIIRIFKTVPDLHLDWNNCRNNRSHILHFDPNESSFYLRIYNEFDQGCQVRPRHPDWNLQTLPLSWNRFFLRLLKIRVADWLRRSENLPISVKSEKLSCGLSLSHVNSQESAWMTSRMAICGASQLK